MSFECQITFTGLGILVPGLDEEGAVDKVCIVMPNGRLAEAEADQYKGLDDTGLERHRSFCRFRLNNHPSLSYMDPEAEGVWYLPRQRLTFDLRAGGDNTLRGLDTLTSVPELRRLFTGTTLEDELPDLDTQLLDPDCLAAPPEREQVATQIWLTQGEFSQHKRSQGNWAIYPRFENADQYIIGRMAHHIRVTLRGLDHFAVIAHSLDDPRAEPRPLTLEPAPGEQTVELTIANFCDENPLEWKSSIVQAYPDDRDFKWYYELLARPVRDWVREHIPEVDIALGPCDEPENRSWLPIPMPVDGGKAQGQNCDHVKVPPMRFDLPG